ncbi:FIST N-terminal domain-containing protein [Tropicibacter sp. S64]|uniref:FIST N-terminal domain-containing protein n=1 Tax=Tropicibacter sp. S64 TaxID=3415122 RepID=UPI003C7A3541
MRDDPIGPRYVTVAHSTATDPRQAVDEVAPQIDLQTTRFVLVFVPAHMDLAVLGEALDAALGGVPAFGCTTAGQITPDGYANDSLLLIAFPARHFRCASVLYDQLDPLNIPEIISETTKHAARFRHSEGWERFALLFTDGLSNQEDLLASTLESALGDLPIFGGSAGDGLQFRETFVLHRGRFHSNAAVLLLLETNLEFRGLTFDHFMPTDTQVVITSANPEKRVVYEINGAPAAPEYARLVGHPVEALSPQIFAENPLLVLHKQRHYVRAISDVTPTQGLTFMAAIDDGLIMTLGRGKEIVDTLRSGLGLVNAAGAPPDFVLAFDCVLRRLEIDQKGLTGVVSERFNERRVFGFNTYGEQHRGLHMNQTFVGVAFFGPERRSLL